MMSTNTSQYLMRAGVVILAVLTTYLSECSIPEFYMGDFCGSHTNLRVDGSLLLHFTRLVSLPQSRTENTLLMSCQLSVSAFDKTNRLLLHIIKLHIDLKHPDRLHIYELSGHQLIRLSPATGLYGKYGGTVQISSDGITDYKTTGDTFYLDYKGLPTQEYSGFTILFTEFHDIPDYVGSCLGTFFQCSTAKICISSTLKCDSYRNCGEYDSSDEVSCANGLPEDANGGSHDSTMPIALSVGIVATLTFLLVSLAIFLVTRLRRRQILSNSRGNNSLRGSLTQTPETNESGLNLATLYAPPSYEDVMSSTATLNRENPPPYDSLVALNIEEISLQHGASVSRGTQDRSTSTTGTPALPRASSLILSSGAGDKDEDPSESIVTTTFTNIGSGSNTSSEDRTDVSRENNIPTS